MSKDTTEEVKPEKVKLKLKKSIVQNRENKAIGDEIEITPEQKKRLTESGHI